MSKLVGVTVIIRDQDGRYLLHQRKDGARCDAGLWGAPGGMVERDEDVLSAARREVMEETCCRLTDVRLAGVYDLPSWLVVLVRGSIYGQPEQRASEVHKAGPWRWLTAAQVSDLMVAGQLQGGLAAWFGGCPALAVAGGAQ